MKCSTPHPSRWALTTLGPILLAAILSTAFAVDSPLVGAWQLDPEQSGQAALYLFTPTHYSMVAASTGRPDIPDMSKATADKLRAIWGPLLANAGTPMLARRPLPCLRCGSMVNFRTSTSAVVPTGADSVSGTRPALPSNHAYVMEEPGNGS